MKPIVTIAAAIVAAVLFVAMFACAAVETVFRGKTVLTDLE
jgi:hypothetical protein